MQCKSMDWFLYDRDLRRERVKTASQMFDRIQNTPLHVPYRSFYDTLLLSSPE